MADPDQTLDFLESQIPAISGSAFDVAYIQALATGQRVVVSLDDGVYEISPDGQRRLLSPGVPRQRVAIGTRIHIP
jgi:hypothetical protein